MAQDERKKLFEQCRAIISEIDSKLWTHSRRLRKESLVLERAIVFGLDGLREALTALSDISADESEPPQKDDESVESVEELVKPSDNPKEISGESNG